MGQIKRLKRINEGTIAKVSINMLEISFLSYPLSLYLYTFFYYYPFVYNFNKRDKKKVKGINKYGKKDKNIPDIKTS
jgi:hypothetical protein